MNAITSPGLFCLSVCPLGLSVVRKVFARFLHPRGIDSAVPALLVAREDRWVDNVRVET